MLNQARERVTMDANTVLSTRDALLKAIEEELKGVVSVATRAAIEEARRVPNSDITNKKVTREHAQKIVQNVIKNINWVDDDDHEP